MRKLSQQQLCCLEEARDSKDIYPYAVVDGLRSLSRANTAESLARLGLLKACGSGAMRCFSLSDTGRLAAAFIKRPEQTVHPPLPDYEFSTP